MLQADQRKPLTHVPRGTSKKTASDPELSREDAKLARYNLGSISVEDLMEAESDPAGDPDSEARKEYVARIHGVLEILKKEYKHVTFQQLDFNSRWSENWEQVAFGRGGINLVSVLLERWEKLSVEHMENIKESKLKEEKFNKHKPISETE